MKTTLDIAVKELGITELAGTANNPRIVEYLKATVYGKINPFDSVPWCAAFVSWCLDKAGMFSMKSTWARDYLKYPGEDIPLESLQPGDIVVFTRGKVNGHVFFYLGRDSNWIYGIGGNQSDAVTVGKYAVSSFLGAKRPCPVSDIGEAMRSV